MHFGDGFRGSDSVEIINDSEPYEMARALDSDDDRPVGELTESDFEMMRRIFPSRRDPRVHKFNDLAHSDQAFVEGRDDELLEAPEASPNMVIEKTYCYLFRSIIIENFVVGQYTQMLS